ncbi:phytanoyl-CoA dioxygenase [Lineolata rhizophorae]|uniref:Phytanoyl-CoA dioxygenase n=1 Tax=Lineolata rhizophorae TaxID=578093 RepID=A0A6A6NZV6_9PEZI|nr:phytanoyl-CoA dioxygenase [Lineolata rhizophorae]
MNGTATPDLQGELSTNGFVRIPSALSSDQIESLRDACSTATSRARAGNWPHIRTLPKQFPPWPSDANGGIWGVQHLLHPDQPGNDVFASSYFGDTVMGPAKRILGCDDEDMVMELYNLLVRPERDFELRWHRDDIPASASPEEEMKRLSKPAWHAQWNLALFEDSSLVVVPGSHKRPRAEVERSADPYEAELPGMLIVEMKPGDLVFYDNNILHRGVYRADVERMTLHGSVGHVRGGNLRARNVLQHAVGEWVDQCDFGKLDERTKQRAEGMRKRLVELGSWNKDVGYSLED